MAKSKPASKPAVPLPAETKVVRLELTLDQHSRLRVLAAQNGQSMAAFARTVIVKTIDDASDGASPQRAGKR